MRKYISYHWDKVVSSTLSEFVSLFGKKINPPQISNEFSRYRIFTPWRTFWLFLGQILSATRSCREALEKAHMRLSLFEPDKEKISSSTAGYCKARQRLSSDYIDDVERQVRQRVESQTSEKRFWHGRPVKVVDGTSVSMPDTQENQKLYPQPTGQKKGCGFPVMRLVISFCLTTGIILSCRKSSLKRHERRLWHEMWDDYQNGDIVLADCGFCSFADYAILSQKGVDCVMRLHQARKEKEIIKKFNKNDYLVQWDKGSKPPKWMTKEEWEKLPSSMVVRHVRVNVDIPGFRTKNLTVATTLLDAKKYPTEDIAELYRRRWMAELFIRDIKTTMDMDILRCKTPQMVHKELSMFIIAYNLIRLEIWQDALKQDVDPYKISLAGTIATIRQWAQTSAILQMLEMLETFEMMENFGISERRIFLIQRMREYIAADRLPNRSEIRVEPGAVKRRPKTFQLMTKPRKEFKEIPHRHKYKASKTKTNKGM